MEKNEPSLSEELPSLTLPPVDKGEDWMERMEANRALERQVLERLLQTSLDEQKRSRRGKNWFRLFLVLYLLALLWLGNADEINFNTMSIKHKHVAVVDMRGVIMEGMPSGANMVNKGLKEAFEHPDTEGVILRINSPGGSPVQAGQIYDEVMRLQKRYAEMPLYAALEDFCASGGYYVASAFPKIYADKASLVGSIGVMMQNFGFQQSLEKLGVESRTMTAGKNKAFLDPFGPMNPSEKQHAQGLLNRIHEQFIKAVEAGRGDRLKAGRDELFQGLIWTGEDAVKLGLVDGLGSSAWIARQLIKNERIVDFTHKEDFFTRVSKGMAGTLMNVLPVGEMSGWQWR
ncbi:MAG: S49 family peptidase [Magnetococcales bacterium]|nr:S49 family peptidase [Magnetococcales bacterium]MBF0438409.1 S49 family peptidase [Magnetococcales bacterium]